MCIRDRRCAIDYVDAAQGTCNFECDSFYAQLALLRRQQEALDALPKNLDVAATCDGLLYYYVILSADSIVYPVSYTHLSSPSDKLHRPPRARRPRRLRRRAARAAHLYRRFLQAVCRQRLSLIHIYTEALVDGLILDLFVLRRCLVFPHPKRKIIL